MPTSLVSSGGLWHLLTADDLAAYLQIGKRTLWRHVSGGQFPQPDIRRGKFVRWKPETVEAWINAGGQEL